MRAAFDKLLSWFGVVLAVVLLAVGGVALFASNFIGSQVKEQFGMQEITMPTADTLNDPEYSDADRAALMPHAGKPMDNGFAAKAYANHYILVHMNASGVALLKQAGDLGVSGLPDTMNYANASTIATAVTKAAATAAGADAASYKCGTGDNAPAADSQEGKLCTLAASITSTRTSTFLNGNTLRGMLLFGYAFATMGVIAEYAGIGALIAGVVLLVFAFIGFAQAKKSAAAESKK
jgi:hypothetical protein